MNMPMPPSPEGAEPVGEAGGNLDGDRLTEGQCRRDCAERGRHVGSVAPGVVAPNGPVARNHGRAGSGGA
jgi:hypothetical protein